MKAPKMSSAERLYPDAFFVLRTPLLPVDELEDWGADLEVPNCSSGASGVLEAKVASDRGKLRSRLAELLIRPGIRDALAVASPSLLRATADWRADPDGPNGRRVELSLVRYLTRMATRATPFGLFAGVTVGTLEATTGTDLSSCRLRLAGIGEYRRKTTLDSAYLLSCVEEWIGGRLAAALEDGDLATPIRLRANSSLYRVSTGWRYVESTTEKSGLRRHRLAAVEATPSLDRIIEAARMGATIAQLVEIVLSTEPADGEDAEPVTRGDALEFLLMATSSQVLVPDIEPRITSPSLLGSLISDLASDPEAEELVRSLARTEAHLQRIDSRGVGATSEEYEVVRGRLERELAGTINPRQLFKVDMMKPAEQASLGGELIDEILGAVGVLRDIRRQSAAEPELDGFRERFTQRFGEDRDVPLALALDEDFGVGFGSTIRSTAVVHPLLADLHLVEDGGDRDGVRRSAWSDWHAFLLARVQEAVRRGETEIELREEHLELLRIDDAEHRFGTPDALHALAEVSGKSEEAVNRGEFDVFLRHAGGPSGARMLGRFANHSADLEAGVLEHLHQEELARPDAIFAEIVHLPAGRVGNILERPVLRAYEIPYLGRGGAAEENQIPISDLRVSVRDDRVVLISHRLGREVLPRLTAAHDFNRRGIAVYRFLCALQRQGVLEHLSWDWGALESAPFLPRVRMGRVVLARARWNLLPEQIAAMREARGVDLLIRVRQWREANDVPRRVLLVDGDRELLGDLENILSLEAFVDALPKQSEAQIVELFPAPDHLWVTGPEGRFFHEIIVPCHRHVPAKAASRAYAPSPHVSVARLRSLEERSSEPRQFPPGSEWLFAKLYTGEKIADEVIREVVRPVARKALESRWCDRWFFIRYKDPEWHLRLRFHGPPAGLLEHVLPFLVDELEPFLASSAVWKLQLDSYQREMARYGGPCAMPLVEKLFFADSEVVAEILCGSVEEEDPDARWRITTLALDRLFSDLGMELEAKLEVARNLRESFAEEFHADVRLKRQIGERFRQHRDALIQLLTLPYDGHAPDGWVLPLLEWRSRTVAPWVEELRGLIATERMSISLPQLSVSLAHMHVNRMMPSSGRAFELVLYDFLYRHYRAFWERERYARGGTGVRDA